MARFKNSIWNVPTSPFDANQPASTESAILATLMDIRDELQRLNRVFECPNALAIPDYLREIRNNTKKPRRRRAAKKGQ